MNVAGPAHQVIVDEVLRQWPEHEGALGKAMPEDPAVRANTEALSRALLALVGDDLPRCVAGYRWMCRMVLEEELEFRRNDRYRFSSFAEVAERVYSDPTVMAGYMDGLLVSQVLWANHIAIADFYVNRYLTQIGASKHHLEVGPGHGLLLWLAAKATSGTLTGWDVSETSLGRTRHALETLGARPVSLVLQNLFAEPAEGQHFDSVVISEVLEHLEDPARALQALALRMPPGAWLFANAPINSPAIDHIWLYRTPEALVDQVRSSGFEIIETRFAPATGFSEARARKMRLSISCAVVARRTS